MLQELFKLLAVFKDLYFYPIKIDHLQNSSDLTNFGITAAYFLIFMIVFHSIVIYIGTNINNSYPYFKMILLSCSYSFTVAFALAKILQMFSVLALYFMPYIGQYLTDITTFVALIITFTFEYFLMKNRLSVLYQRGHLDSEAIPSDLFIGVILANLAGFLLFIKI